MSTANGALTAITSVSLEKGVWIVACNIRFTQASATGARGLAINYNSEDTTLVDIGTVASEWVTLNTTMVVELSSAQTVTLKGYQTSGGALTANGSINCVRIKG